MERDGREGKEGYRIANAKEREPQCSSEILKNVSEVGVVVLGDTSHASVSSSLLVGRAILPVPLDVRSPHVETEETVADELSGVGAKPRRGKSERRLGSARRERERTQGDAYIA
jgi:hypothetical protein